MSLTFDEAVGKFLLRLPKSPFPSIFPVGEEQAYIEAYNSILSDRMLGPGIETSTTLSKLMQRKLSKGVY